PTPIGWYRTPLCQVTPAVRLMNHVFFLAIVHTSDPIRTQLGVRLPKSLQIRSSLTARRLRGSAECGRQTVVHRLLAPDLFLVGDEADAALVGEVVEGPVGQHDH